MWSNKTVMKIPRYFVVFLLLSASLVINACGGLTRSDKAATKTWWLQPYTGVTVAQPSDPALLVDVSITVIPGLDTNRILTLSQTAELNHYSGARWADNLPELATSLVARTLQASPGFEVVPDRTPGGREDCDLKLEIQKFFAAIDVSGVTTAVRVAMDGQYQCGQNKPVSIQLNASVPVNDDRMSAIVAAFQQAMDGVMRDMLEKLK